MMVVLTETTTMVSTIEVKKDAISSGEAVLSAFLAMPFPCFSEITKPNCAAGTETIDRNHVDATIFNESEKLSKRFSGNLTIFSYRVKHKAAIEVRLLKSEIKLTW